MRATKRGNDRAPPQSVLITITAAVSAILTFIAVKLLDYLRRKDAETEARQIVETAEREMQNRRREVELELKELAIQQKAEGEKELRKLRKELHERERIPRQAARRPGTAGQPTSETGKGRRERPAKNSPNAFKRRIAAVRNSTNFLDMQTPGHAARFERAERRGGHLETPRPAQHPVDPGSGAPSSSGTSGNSRQPARKNLATSSSPPSSAMPRPIRPKPRPIRSTSRTTK